MISGVVDMIAAGLAAIAAVAPGVVSALTGGQGAEAAIKAARDAIEALPERGGDDGSWAADLSRRERGE